MAARATKTCKRCGCGFTASKTDYTVNCPDCRRRPTTATADAHAEARAVEAKRAAYAARKAGDTAAYEKALDELRFYRAVGARV